MINFLQSLNKKNYFISLAFGTVIYFSALRLFQDWLYHRMGIDVRPSELFASFGPKFMIAEPFEVPLYLIGYLAVPLVAYFLTPLARKINWPRVLRLVVALAAAAILAGGILILARLDFGQIAEKIQDKGLGHLLFVLVTKRIYVAYIILALTALFGAGYYLFGRHSLAGYFQENRENFFRKFRFLGLAAIAAIVFNPSFPVDVHHFNYFLGAVNDLYEGKGILYESSHLYGLLDVYFLAILFKLIPLTYPIVALLVAVSYFFFFMLIYMFLRRWLASYTLATLGTAVVVAILYLFQTSPTRWVLFFPGMSPFRWGMYLPVLFLVLKFSQNPKPKYMHWAFLISTIAIFWNFDTGLYVSCATIAIFGYYYLARNWQLVDVFKPAMIYLAYLAGIFAVINIGNYLVYQDFPTWSLFLKETRYFTQGAGMYPLPAVGLYQIIFVTYLSVMLVAGYKLLINRQTINLPLAFLAIYGAFSLIYYIGESTWQLMYVVTVPFVMIWCYGLARYYRSGAAPQYTQYTRLVSTAFAMLLVLGGLLYVFKLPVEFSTRDYAATRRNLLEIRPDEQTTFEDAKTIRDNIADERIPLIATNDTQLLIYSGKANYFDFYYYFTIYYRSEVRRYIDQVRSENPPYLIVGRDKQRNDQVEFFLAGVSDLYQPAESLQTVEIYRLK